LWLVHEDKMDKTGWLLTAGCFLIGNIIFFIFDPKWFWQFWREDVKRASAYIITALFGGVFVMMAIGAVVWGIQLVFRLIRSN
jgi:hypothetical protein